MFYISPNILGKKDGDKVLSLFYHLKDVASVGAFLWDAWLCLEVKEEIERVLPQARSILLLACYLHDLGKSSKSFQDKLFSNERDKNKEVDHVTLTNYMLVDYLEKHTGNNMTLYRDSLVRELISYHHGIESPISLESIEYYKSKTNYINFDDLCLYIDSVLSKLGLSPESLIIQLKNIPFYVKDILSGLLIMSDWLGSNPEFFPCYKNVDFSYEGRSQYALCKLSKLLNNTFRNDIIISEFSFQYLFGFSPNELQKSVMSVDLSSKRLVFIEAPTGHGKTEAALSLAFRYMKETNRGLYIAMPTRATSNALFYRVENPIKKVYVNTESCKLYHSKADLFFYSNEDSLCNDRDSMGLDRRVRDSIFHYKLTNARTFIIGTTDHVLKMCMNVKHFTMHHACLINHVIVFDEVHSYDSRMFSSICASLSFLAKYNVPVIILSATMPSDKRKKLIEAYGRNKSLCLNAFPKDDLTGDDDIVVRVKEKEKSKIVSIDLFLQPEYCSPTDHDKDAIAIINKIKELGLSGYYGIVVNTVDRANKLYDLFIKEFGKDKVSLLHSRMIAKHRSDVEKKIISLLGKQGYDKRKKENYFNIVISTQIVEQSIDIDFDCLFTDLCPMDALIQRLGRLHRHEQNNLFRPSFLKKPICYIMQAYSNTHGNEGLSYHISDFSSFTDDYAKLIYSPYLLCSTYSTLLSLKGNTIDTVMDTEKLIKEVYSNDSKKSLYGVSLDTLYSDYVNDTRIKEKSTYSDMFPIKNKNTPRSLKQFKEYLDCSYLLENGLNEVKDADVRDTLASLEVILVEEDIGENGDIVYRSSYDGSIISSFSKEYTDSLSLNLPTKVIHKCNGKTNLRKLLDETKPECVRLNRSPFLVFKEGSYLLHTEKGNLLLWYDKDKGLLIES